MSSIDLKLDYAGAINDPDNIKKDLRKALRIATYSMLSALVFTGALYLLAGYLQSLITG